MVFYAHSGSDNHGNEAIIKSTLAMLNTKVKLFSAAIDEDKKYGIDKIADLIQENKIKQNSPKHLFFYIKKRITKNPNCYYCYAYKELLKVKDDVCVSIGDDIYTSDKYFQIQRFLLDALKSNNNKTVLFGCSVEPDLFKNPQFVDHMKKYDLITVCESISYEAMAKAGLTNIKLYPEPSFSLNKQATSLINDFIDCNDGNTIGINISPSVLKYNANDNIVFNNYVNLIKFILEDTLYNIALIPHVVNEDEAYDDRVALQQIKNAFKNNNRVYLVPNCNCQELKGYISKCKIFIGARNHANIAAYSSFVPTLAVGYTTKAKGIATDIFGSYKNYVVNYKDFKTKDDLLNSFKWISVNESKIRRHLKEFIPNYIENSLSSANELKNLLDNTDL